MGRKKKKKASNGAVHESEECFHICGAGGYGCCQIQTITQQDVRSSRFTKRLRAVYESTVLHGDHSLQNWATHSGSYLYLYTERAGYADTLSLRLRDFGHYISDELDLRTVKPDK